MKKINIYYKEPKYNDVIKETNEDEFEIGQVYSGKSAKKIKCKRCNGYEFYVGVGEYFTAIKCVNCHWEKGIHEG